MFKIESWFLRILSIFWFGDWFVRFTWDSLGQLDPAPARPRPCLQFLNDSCSDPLVDGSLDGEPEEHGQEAHDEEQLEHGGQRGDQGSDPDHDGGPQHRSRALPGHTHTMTQKPATEEISLDNTERYNSCQPTFIFAESLIVNWELIGCIMYFYTNSCVKPSCGGRLMPSNVWSQAVVCRRVWWYVSISTHLKACACHISDASANVRFVNW